ncbi:MAG: hypothetical protein A2234_07215 [Elusimicrobia bacterium RIFOXYA2_FULL_58_8]|nr:MAG: hypothetical protein A2234_07215 [Elusimicrobia bacterium RIFOXYA2_FULL_58_8]OGS12662.1 MAG: hypothetical protein A2285_07705 [Elusimicrobia bacterium RIFOXYA12_FULL_57_11]
MKKFILFTTVCCLLLLSGCGLIKQKAAGYYLSKARAAAQLENPAAADLEQAFVNVEKASGYAPDSPLTVIALEELAAASEKSGFARGQELQSAILRKMVAHNPFYWAAREALVDFMAARGDLNGLAGEAIAAGKLAADKDLKKRYCALLVQLTATASAVPWLESEAYLNLNKSPEVFFEKAAIYSSAAAKVAEIKSELEKMATVDVALKNFPPQELVSAAEVACSDALKDKEEISRAADFNAKAEADPVFKKAVAMTVQGNAALVGREYSKARAFYQGALSYYPDMIEARRQMAEVDFQEGASLAAVGEKSADQLLGKAYGGSNAVIKEAVSNGSNIPFMPRDKFMGDTYALKAAVISAIRAMKGKKFKKTARLETEFKAALDEALKLSPEGRLARELLERYTKEGF